MSVCIIRWQSASPFSMVFQLMASSARRAPCHELRSWPRERRTAFISTPVASPKTSHDYERCLVEGRQSSFSPELMPRPAKGTIHPPWHAMSDDAISSTRRYRHHAARAFRARRRYAALARRRNDGGGRKPWWHGHFATAGVVAGA